MPKWARITLLIALLGVVGLIAWQVVQPREPEPVYKGKPLSKWLLGYEPGDRMAPNPRTDTNVASVIHRIFLRDETRRDAVEAVRSIVDRQRQNCAGAPEWTRHSADGEDWAKPGNQWKP
jgi:hypothetical protein